MICHLFMRDPISIFMQYHQISFFMRNAINVNFLVFMRYTMNVTSRKSFMDDYTCKHWKWPFKTTVPNSNSFVGLSHLISNLRYMGSNMFIFKVWTTFLGERKIRTKFHSANACCELKSRLFDFFEQVGKCASWVQILFNFYNLVVSTSNFSNM